MKNRTSLPIFGILLLALTLLAYFIPNYDWDLVAYVGSAIELHEHDSHAIQAEAYAALQRELPQDDYADIARGSGFRRDVALNADHFRQQLRFYQIRPLYIRFLAAMHATGIDYVKATRMLSAMSFFALGILLFRWLRQDVNDAQAALCIPILLVAPVFFTSARIGSPDALSALAVLFGTFQIAERNRLLLGSAFLLLSLFLRTDNVIFAVLLLGSTAIQEAEWRRRVMAALLVLLTLGTVFAINHTQHSYPWSLLMRNTATPIVNPAEVTPEISAGDYFAAVHDMIDEARENSVAVFPFLAVVALLSWRTPIKLKHLVKLVLLSWAAHIALFPHIEDRYFISGASLIGVAVICAALSKPSEAPLPVGK